MAGPHSQIDRHVGARLRLRRMAIGMSQEKLGRQLGVTFQQVQKYEKGVNRIGAGRLFVVAEVLGVPVQYFYDGLESAERREEAEQAGREGRDFARLLASPDGVRLNLAFQQIPDPATRRRIVDLVRTVAREGGLGPRSRDGPR